MTLQSDLTEKEKTIIRELANGGCGKEVASRLNMNRNTLNTLLLKIRLRTNCVNTTHLIYKLSKNNII